MFYKIDLQNQAKIAKEFWRRIMNLKRLRFVAGVFVFQLQIALGMDNMAVTADKTIILLKLFNSSVNLVQASEKQSKYEVFHFFQKVGACYAMMENSKMEVPEMLLPSWHKEANWLSNAMFSLDQALLDEYFSKVYLTLSQFSSSLSLLYKEIDINLLKLKGYHENETLNLLSESYEQDRRIYLSHSITKI
jgi:hypothetical protein